MLLKGLVVTTLLATTPFAFVASQDPQPSVPPAKSGAANPLDTAARAAAAAESHAARAKQELDDAKRELETARGELRTVRRQLEGALDALDRSFEPQRDRNCSPSRSRALMSHYQWLRDEGHAQRAANALAKVVEQVGDDPHRLNSAAWHLMNDQETAGKFDELALAIATRMEQRRDELDPRAFDTIAMARFLAGDLERAVELQAEAIARGGNADEYRRRLRTYQAAQAAVAKAGGGVPAAQPATMVASKE